MFTVVKPVPHSENGSIRKHAIGKRRVGPGNIGHFSKTFPFETLHNIFKVLISLNIVKIRRMHLKRQSFDNCDIQEPAYWLVLMRVSLWDVSDSQADSVIGIKYLDCLDEFPSFNNESDIHLHT